MTGRLEEVLGVDVPIVLGPFGGLSSVELTAVVSNAGGLGSYGLYGYDTARIRSAVDQLRAATGRPFALNLWLATGDENKPRDCDLGSLVRPLVPLFSELGLVNRPGFSGGRVLPVAVAAGRCSDGSAPARTRSA